jgi:5-(carboxyamino)imidazole ribonucleotide mutase
LRENSTSLITIIKSAPAKHPSALTHALNSPAHILPPTSNFPFILPSSFSFFHLACSFFNLPKIPFLCCSNFYSMAPQVGIIMGSDSDLPVMQAAADVLKELGVSFELTVVSAHRTPRRMVDYASSAKERGLRVIIAGAGGAAHLPGMVASLTPLPVIGVPIKSSNSIDGWDSVLSILQMPNGIPVATVALNAAKNAGILAASIIGAFDEATGNSVAAYKNKLESEVLSKVEKLKQQGWQNNFD